MARCTSSISGRPTSTPTAFLPTGPDPEEAAEDPRPGTAPGKKRPPLAQGPSGHRREPVAGYTATIWLQRPSGKDDQLSECHRTSCRLRRWLQPQLVAVRYFTARVRNDPPAERRQQTYLNALAAHSSLLDIRQGRFQQKSKTCHSCGSSWFEYEEKETDVSLSVSLLEDGVNRLYDTALIVSADSDMSPAIRALRRVLPGVRVMAALPPNRRSFGLLAVCDATIPIGMAKVRQSQLPNAVRAGSHILLRPPHWS